MAFIDIDNAKCCKDGLCADVCPMGLIVKRGDGTVEPIKDVQDRCLRCGQCISVCPKAALTLDGVKPEELERFDRGLLPSLPSLDMLFKSRRSIRMFKSGPAPRETILAALDIARRAPSAVNFQPTNWLVLERGPKFDEVAKVVATELRNIPYFKRMVRLYEKGYDVLFRGAPQVIIAHADASSFSPASDCVIAMTWFELEAHARGLGCCWAGVIIAAARQSQAVRDVLDLPAGHEPFAAMMLGVPRVSYARIPNRKELSIRWM